MKKLKMRRVKRWGNGDKYVPRSVGGGLKKLNGMLAYWSRVGQWGTFKRRKNKRHPAPSPLY